MRPSAAEVLLGEGLGSIEPELTANWRRNVLAGWRERHRRAARVPRREATESAVPSPRTEDTPALWRAARDAAELGGTASAEPLLRDVLAREPGHAGACVVLGNHLLSIGDAEGERLLFQVINHDQADEQWLPRAFAVLQEHYRATGQSDRLHDVRARLDRHDTDIALARRERTTITASDPIQAHGLEDAQLVQLWVLLASQPDCEGGWLARKTLLYFPYRPLFLLCVRGEPGAWGLARPERDQALVKQLIPKVQLPGQVLVLARQGSLRRLAARVMKLPGAEVFRRQHHNA